MIKKTSRLNAEGILFQCSTTSTRQGDFARAYSKGRAFEVLRVCWTTGLHWIEYQKNWHTQYNGLPGSSGETPARELPAGDFFFRVGNKTFQVGETSPEQFKRLVEPIHLYLEKRKESVPGICGSEQHAIYFKELDVLENAARKAAEMFP